MRKFLQNMKANNPELFKIQNLITDTDFQKDIADTYNVGDRCKILADGQRGELRYIGRIPDLSEGFYVGVQLDEPYGLNDGSVNGVNYFNCPSKYGIFVRPDKVAVGDFPEIDPFDDSSEEIDEI